ncbi:hypothetical protein HCG51_10655 [Tolypothrix sp. PCC 7910]|uniref:hypothetical protein n=1 Tax=Tolypothrix sp. PCC 7910 TaxID=2099387 RepID=UPI0014279C0A|nr:hypothetical protein [Tolypothrix sp. PCC 7910]QIR37139.1 hypothetical protein HCG51_10655 [Tolypothrix sp. PCC 7910]
MPNWSAIEASFLHLTQPQQLRELAACLARLKSWVKNSAKGEIVPVLLEESLLYLSLIQQNSEVNNVELNQLIEVLQDWKLNWVNTWSESTQSANMADCASTWSVRVLDMSGLLTNQSISA